MIIKEKCEDATSPKKSNAEIIKALKPGTVFIYKSRQIDHTSIHLRVHDTISINIGGPNFGGQNVPDNFNGGIIEVKPNATLLLEGC